MRALQKELDELRRDKERDSHRAREDGEELRLLREQCERLENEQSGGVSIICHHIRLDSELNLQADLDIVDQLRTDMEGLLTELSDLSHRNDELMTAKDSDLVVIRDLDGQLKEYKRKYEQAKTELRSVKGMSEPHCPKITYSLFGIFSHISAIPPSPETR
jgi:DNA repair exonuclease SbcCD ATPase subunit